MTTYERTIRGSSRTKSPRTPPGDGKRWDWRQTATSRDAVPLPRGSGRTPRSRKFHPDDLSVLAGRQDLVVDAAGSGPVRRVPQEAVSGEVQSGA